MSVPLFRRRRRSMLLAGGVLGVLLLSGCSGGLLGDDSDGDSTDGPIVLGMLTPTSGSSAAIGPHMRNGAQLAIDEINAKGGVNGRKLELKVEDEGCDAKTAAAGANKLVTQQIAVSVGGYCSSATLPTLAIFNKAGIPMLIPAANSNDLVDQRLPNVFLINGTGTQQAEAALRYMAKTGVTRVALMDDNTSYSKNITDLTAAKLKAGTSPALAARQSVTPGESDYAANIDAVLKTKPDFVYWTGYYQEGGLIIRQLRQAGYRGAVMVADGAVDAKLVEIAGAANGEGVLATMTQTAQTTQGATDWIASYKAKFGAEPGPFSTQSYDAVRIAAEAIGKAGSTRGADIIKALEAIDGFQIFSGPLKFTADHTLTTGGFQILEVKGGTFQLKDAAP